MRLKARPREMNTSAIKLSRIFEDLTKEIGEMEELVASTKEVWEGTDADTFEKIRMKEYINELHKIAHYIDKLYIVLTTSVKKYGFCDDKFNGQIKNLERNIVNG